MARPKRITLPFCLYHVMSRTNPGYVAFRDRWDRDKFFHYLAKYVDMFDFRVHAFCLMRNHFHLLLESGKRAEISELMRRLLTAYTIYYNRRHRTHGNLFQGRFKSYVVDKSDYLLSVSRYIHLNPANADHPGDPWSHSGSSLRYYINGNEPDLLYTSEILSWFGNDRKKYRKFVEEGLDEEGIRLEIHSQRFIGGRHFTKRMNQRLVQLKQTGSRADKARKKSIVMIQSEDRIKADKIRQIVCDYYDIHPDVLNPESKRHGAFSKAKTLFIGLLREFLPWDSGTIKKYFGMRGNVYPYIWKIQKSPDLLKDFEKLKRMISARD